MSLTLMSEEQLREIRPNSQYVKAIDLLSPSDLEYVRANEMMFVAFQVDDVQFLAKLEQKVPKQAVVVRRGNRVEGFPALRGGC